MSNLVVKEGKLFAVVSHFWLIGLVIAWVLNLKKQNTFTNFYVRQMLGFNLLLFLEGGLAFLGGFIKWVLGVVLFVFWLISVFGAITGEKKLIPFFGPYFQDWFKSL